VEASTKAVQAAKASMVVAASMAEVEVVTANVI
jgi:hypothetical protein